MYHYDEINGLDIIERSLSIESINNDKIIIFNNNEISQFKGNYE